MTQPEVKPPTFIVFANNARLLHYSYLRYIENRLRGAFGFEGVPLRIKVRAKEEKIEGGRRLYKEGCPIEEKKVAL